MKQKQFKLSKFKVKYDDLDNISGDFVYNEEDVDEFIQRVKNELFGYEFDKCICNNSHCKAHEKNINAMIDRLKA